MQTYHLRRKEKEIKELSELHAMLTTETVLTLAMCKNNEPYLVTLDYVFDPLENCLYFHCAREGKKISILAENNRVWGQVLEDNGYIQGQCDHAFRCIHFDGSCHFIDDPTEKHKALELLLAKFEPNSNEIKEKFLKDPELPSVLIGKIQIGQMTGKRSPKP